MCSEAIDALYYESLSKYCIHQQCLVAVCTLPPPPLSLLLVLFYHYCSYQQQLQRVRHTLYGNRHRPHRHVSSSRHYTSLITHSTSGISRDRSTSLVVRHELLASTPSSTGM